MARCVGSPTARLQPEQGAPRKTGGDGIQALGAVDGKLRDHDDRGHPTAAKMVSHILTYSSIIPGTAGSVISPATTDRRYNRRAMDSRSFVESTELRGEFSIEIFLHDPACSDQTIRCQRKAFANATFGRRSGSEPARLSPCSLGATAARHLRRSDRTYRSLVDHAPNGWLLREEL